MLARIKPSLATLPRFAKIRAVHLTTKPWTIEAGFLTATLKTKRDVILKLFAKEIEALYGQQ